ncbi:MAG: aldehyde dehydrogenase [Peptoniphilus sp.]|uniref:Aldehyde dehydrogenase EutE n=1 Tax=Peptoniphilus porci TaxID=2652280 RepID=A0A1U7M1K8_9FIRM|nr:MULTISPECIES: aldehyde dehydrogenase [Peptoniphilus]MCI5642844.1 aldehyde dehydrogenase [Peptoniphilus sp.]MDD7353223.1 aldehyde dehydrogenase [Peptoniphilaceae bacterium]MDY3903156.1 aldehyde dehydrogenase [Peptoniphilus sp.]OLR65534.1 aldehyde dehydrogenase EutE [Peptoniphilus porci]
MNKRSVFDTVCEAIDASKSAHKLYIKLGISDREEIIRELRKELLNHVDELAQIGYEETCMGCVEDKVVKIKLAIEKTPGTEDLLSEVLTKDKVMTLYEYSAFGIACAVMPSTNPVATVINNVIGLLAAGNSVILCPHPRAIKVTKYLTDIIATTILKVCGIDNLVSTLSEVSMKNISEIMHHPDVNLLVVTGGSDIARQANKCDKKVISAGSGNPTFIVDETADIEKAANCIVRGASFDNNILCVTEKNIVIVSSIYEKFKKALEKENVFYIDTFDDMLKLSKVLLTEDMKPNKFLGGKSVSEILDFAGIEFHGDYRLIAVDVPKIHPFAIEELLMPVIAIVKACNFEDALEISLCLEQGLRHTAGIHSNSIERLNIAAKTMQTSIFVKNGCSLDGIGFSDDNPVSFTIANRSGEGSTSARNFARRRRCALIDAFSIR